MFIKPIKCSNPQCGAEGWPGSGFGQNYQAAKGWLLHCPICKTVMPGAGSRDQQILSTHWHVRFAALCGYWEQEVIQIQPGVAYKISFRRPIDLICMTSFSSMDSILVMGSPIFSTPSEMLYVTSVAVGQTVPDRTMRAVWSVYGLVEMEKRPTWFIQFCAAAKQLQEGAFKPALLDYAVAFESFVGAFLRRVLTKKLGTEAAEFVMSKSWRIEERVKDVLQLATGKRLTEGPEIYQPWSTNVREIRNDLIHGVSMPVSRDMAEKAHHDVFQAIRWIQSLEPDVPNEMPPMQAVGHLAAFAAG